MMQDSCFLKFWVNVSTWSKYSTLKICLYGLEQFCHKNIVDPSTCNINELFSQPLRRNHDFKSLIHYIKNLADKQVLTIKDLRDVTGLISVNIIYTTYNI